MSSAIFVIILFRVLTLPDTCIRWTLNVRVLSSATPKYFEVVVVMLDNLAIESNIESIVCKSVRYMKEQASFLLVLGLSP